MRNHGEPNFPDPSRKGGRVHETITPGNGPVARANDACKHLLPNGNTIAVSTAAPATPGPSGPGAVAIDCLTLPTSPCYTPMQLRVAYGIKPLLDRGITGRGQTVVLPELPPPAGSPSTGTAAQVPASSDLRQDMARFDSMFHLPAARLHVVNSLAHAASPWMASTEEVGDTEIVHALAPDADIREVLIPSPYPAARDRVVPAVVAALRLALTQGGVVSFSGGTGEQCSHRLRWPRSTRSCSPRNASTSP
jgi:subtilase family serine protease